MTSLKERYERFINQRWERHIDEFLDEHNEEWHSFMLEKFTEYEAEQADHEYDLWREEQ